MRAYVNHFTYAAMVDFDEFLIPKKDANLVDLLGLLVHSLNEQMIPYFVLPFPFFFFICGIQIILFKYKSQKRIFQINLNIIILMKARM